MTGSWPGVILLDLDDTVLEFAPLAEPCWRRVCARFAPQIAGGPSDSLCAAIREEQAWYWGDRERHRRGRLDLVCARREIVAGALSRLGIEDPALAREIADAFSLEREEAIRPLPGAIEAVRHLHEQGVRLALITNGSAADQRRKIDRFELAPLFDCILIEGEFGAGKPDERIYQRALDQLGVTPERAWMVGDNLEWDVQAPQQLGITGIWIDSAGQGLPEDSPVRPGRIVRSLADLV